MERLPFRTRARERIWRETRSVLHGRVHPLIIALIGVAVSGLFSWLVLNKQVKEIVEIGLVSGLGANIIWLVGVLLYNTVRVPWLLDAESNQLIDETEQRAQTAENAIQERNDKNQLHQLFGSLMEVGISLSEDLFRMPTGEHLADWGTKFDAWIAGVKFEIQRQGYYTDSVEFGRAGEKAEPVSGVMDFRNKKERRRRILKAHQDKLAEITQRILP